MIGPQPHLQLKSLHHQFQELMISFPDWTVMQGEHWLLSGKSGSGKTTLLHILSGLKKPTAGELIINNSDICRMSSSEIDKFRREQVGIIFQKAHLISSLTVLENLLAAQYFSERKSDKTDALNILKSLGLFEKANSKSYTLSQGEAQRAVIARALITRPKLILADEPTSSLDDTNTEKVIALLKNLADDAKATLIVSSHDSRLKTHFTNNYNLQK
jgi:putative ABC transport system ATP-binding protein